MNLLLVDNGTKHLQLFGQLLTDDVINVIKPRQLSEASFGEIDAVILSGSSVNSVIGHEDLYQEELNLVESAPVPIVGICLGFELIARVYDAKISRLPVKIEGYLPIKAVDGHSFLNGRSNFLVFEGHRWVVNGLSPELDGLARSETGWEIVKHKEKPVYGVQFHPEVAEEGRDDGRKIFREIINALKLETNL